MNSGKAGETLRMAGEHGGAQFMRQIPPRRVLLDQPVLLLALPVLNTLLALSG